MIGDSIYVYDLTGDAEAHWALAKVYLEAGPAVLAIPELRKVLKIRPDDAEAHNNLGRRLGEVRPDSTKRWRITKGHWKSGPTTP